MPGYAVVSAGPRRRLFVRLLVRLRLIRLLRRLRRPSLRLMRQLGRLGALGRSLWLPPLWWLRLASLRRLRIRRVPPLGGAPARW
jgi:hypothetical protein